MSTTFSRKKKTKIILDTFLAKQFSTTSTFTISNFPTNHVRMTKQYHEPKNQSSKKPCSKQLTRPFRCHIFPLLPSGNENITKTASKVTVVERQCWKIKG